LNTSAFIEAGIVGRPVLALLPEEFRANQAGTLHFRYLTDGGLLTTAPTLDAHLPQLAAMIAGPPADVLERQRGFVRSFVRPYGLDVPATRLLADNVEALPHLRPAAVRQRPGVLGSLGLRALKAFERLPGGRRWMLDQREVDAKRRRADEEGRAVSWV
jgi:hypothetical protein